MTSIDKPKGITVIILDRGTKKSKSMTVYGSDLDEIYKMVKKAFSRD